MRSASTPLGGEFSGSSGVLAENSGHSEQPPFKNRKQFQRWINGHKILNNILLAKWVHEIVATPPDNHPSNFVIIAIS
eukprot:scaffold12492_cov36-Cyclotella_meneghiniana.AAC.10